MRRNKMIALILFSFLSLFFLILSGRMVGSFSLESCSVSDLPDTWTIESLILGEKGKNIFAVKRARIKKEIQSLPYVSSVSVKVKDNKLEVEGKKEEWGMTLTDGDRFYFISSSGMREIDKRDLPSLNEYYLTLFISPSVLNTMLLQDREEVNQLIEIISRTNSSSNLITKAEYDNNKPSIFSGSLVLYLDSVEARLTVKDLREIGKVGECLEIIEQEYRSSRNRMSGEVKEYILDNSMLVVKR